MKDELSIKEEGGNGKGGSENCMRKHRSSLKHICNRFQSIYTRIYLLELCHGQIYLDNSNPFLFDYL